MAPRVLLGRSRSRAPLPSLLRLLSSTAVLLTTAVTPATSLTLHDTGRWTQPVPWSRPAVHLALLRGNQSPFHSQILWWQGTDDENGIFAGGLWGWRPGAWSCSSTPDTAEMVRLPLMAPDSDLMFCSGHTQLADGRLFVAGGTQGGTEFGVRTAYMFDPAADSAHAWVRRDSMQAHRWYPNATTLADGRVLVSSGSHYQHVEFFGGLVNSNTVPTYDSLFRYGIGEGGKVDPAIRSPGQQWPGPRVGHTLTYLGSSSFLFGGKRADGTYTNEFWTLQRTPNEFGADYSYDWNQAVITPAPVPRWMHTAVPALDGATRMIVFGGVGKGESGQDAALDDVWRLWFDSSPTGHGYTWTKVTIQATPDVPGPRYGHVAMWHAGDRRMLMFGGSGTPGGAPIDSALWCLTFTASMDTATWTKLSAVGPSPRVNLAAAYSPGWIDNDKTHTDAYIFGGQLAGGGKSNDLWRLKLGPDPTSDAAWERVTDLGGTPPSPRSWHTLLADGGNHILYLFGGTPQSGTPDPTFYYAHVDQIEPGELKQWGVFTLNSVALTGHTAVFQDGAIFQRTPEIFTAGSTPALDSWTTLDAPRLQEWYPQVFTWKDNTMFVAGPDSLTYGLALNSPSWSLFPNQNTHTFKGGGAVMYRPAKVMKCGSRDTDGGGLATGTTMSIDLNAASPQWQASSNTMIARVNHNLVLLPNGKVLVVGGTGHLNNEANTDSVTQPEIWDPDAANGAGAWSGAGVLAREKNMRDYHSTAILLPDGRVLSTSGNADGATRFTAEIFCPPYLFNTDGTLATRPTIVGAAGRWRYGFPVTLAVSGDTTIRNVCLIHAAATTHAQDQAQRYVPLTLDTLHVDGGGVRQYFLHAPADSFVAPPGDYLLFASSASGVPSVARWVRVGSVYAGQMDTTAPDSLTYNEPLVSDTQIYLDWYAPGDDFRTGTALDYDVEFSNDPVTEQNFGTCTEVSGVPIPLLAGTHQGVLLSRLLPETWYYFGGKVRDRAEHWSALARAQAQTLCFTCGFGSSLVRSRGEDGTRASTRVATGLARVRAFATPTALIGGTSTVRLIAEFSPGASAGWRLSYQDLSPDPSLVSASAEQTVLQEADGAGGWRTHSTVAMDPGALGVRSLGRSGRIVFPAGTALEAIEAAPRAFLCTGAVHSRLGDLLAAGTPLDSVSMDASLGDTLTLSFTPDTSSTVGQDCFFRVLIPSAQTASHVRPQGPQTPDGGLPTSFALGPSRPNPFRHTTTLRYDLPASVNVRLEVFDVQGRRIATLAHEWRSAGRYLAAWDGRTDGGARAPAGVYLCRMIAGSFRAERRLVLTP